MLTLFTIPKPFAHDVAIIQRNAIRSWQRLGATCEIVLCGDEPGVAALASELGAVHLPHIERSPQGTPLLSSAFAQVRRQARHARLCYVNADIILLSDLLPAVARLRPGDGLLVGRRIDVVLPEPWDWAAPDAEQQMREYVAELGFLHAPTGSDYFVYWRDGPLAELPPFRVGRPGWDNWLIFHARELRRSVVDATRVLTAIHQYHNYRHVPGGNGESWEGPEADVNRALLGGDGHTFTLLDATHLMTPRAIRPALGRAHLARRWASLGVLHPRVAQVSRAIRRRLSWCVPGPG